MSAFCAVLLGGHRDGAGWRWAGRSRMLVAQAAFSCVGRDWMFYALAGWGACLQMLEHLFLGYEGWQGPAEEQMLINAEKQSFSLVCSYVQVALHKGLTSIRWCCCWCRGRLWSVMLISKIYLRPLYDTQAVQCSRTHLQGTFSPSFRSRNLEGGSERHFWYSECKNRLRQPRGHIHFLLSNGF